MPASGPSNRPKPRRGVREGCTDEFVGVEPILKLVVRDVELQFGLWWVGFENGTFLYIDHWKKFLYIDHWYFSVHQNQEAFSSVSWKSRPSEVPSEFLTEGVAVALHQLIPHAPNAVP